VGGGKETLPWLDQWVVGGKLREESEEIMQD